MCILFPPLFCLGERGFQLFPKSILVTWILILFLSSSGMFIVLLTVPSFLHYYLTGSFPVHGKRQTSTIIFRVETKHLPSTLLLPGGSFLSVSLSPSNKVMPTTHLSLKSHRLEICLFPFWYTWKASLCPTDFHFHHWWRSQLGNFYTMITPFFLVCFMCNFWLFWSVLHILVRLIVPRKICMSLSFSWPEPFTLISYKSFL